MEVSSHALALGRTRGCIFKTAIFTNLQQDHLDFHKDMESYLRAKLLLFSDLVPGTHSVVNADDTASREIMKKTKSRVHTFGLLAHADVRPKGKIEHSINGLTFSAETPKGAVNVDSALVGRFNIYNILAAIGAGVAMDFGADVIAEGIRNMKAVPGRMEKIDEGQSFGVVVDYAHTEASLVSLLDAVRQMAKGRVITVFGCGGDRDRTKRPKMGSAALNGSDIAIITSDNPRTEDPYKIIAEIETGITETGVKGVAFSAHSVPSGKKPYYVIPDRHEAIAVAIRMAEMGDMVVLAGKGHEDYQIIGKDKIHFDDREIARAEIRKRR
jgi:UDP-N-acetylmuramoyl-L-alanyl-D-glutamate--2,6-diaminopimelate ligase